MSNNNFSTLQVIRKNTQSKESEKYIDWGKKDSNHRSTTNLMNDPYNAKKGGQQRGNNVTTTKKSPLRTNESKFITFNFQDSNFMFTKEPRPQHFHSVVQRNEYQTVGRPSSQNPPPGSRHQYEYTNPNIIPNASFNFWKDINTNVMSRATFDNANLSARGVVEGYLSGGLLAQFHSREEEQKPVRESKSVQRSRERTSRKNLNNIIEAVKQNNNKYAARYMYSQIDLGTQETERDESVHSRRSNYSSTQSMTQLNAPLQTKQKSQGNLLSYQNQLTKVKDIVNQELEQKQEMNLKKKRETYEKCFKSQILELPGPKQAVKRDLPNEYKLEQKAESKLNDEKSRVKANQLYGSYYQENKYIGEFKPSRAFKTYIKGVRSEWNRNPNNEFTKTQRDRLIYNKQANLNKQEMEGEEAVHAAREKLKEKMGNTQIGGKGTQRRKKKHVNQQNVNEDKKLKSAIKKFGVQPLQDIDEVNMFKDDNSVMHFKRPQIQFSVRENLMVVTGNPETKALKDMMPDIIKQVGPQQYQYLKTFMGNLDTAKEPGKEKEAEDDDDVPDLVGTNFEEASKAQ